MIWLSFSRTPLPPCVLQAGLWFLIRSKRSYHLLGTSEDQGILQQRHMKQGREKIDSSTQGGGNRLRIPLHFYSLGRAPRCTCYSTSYKQSSFCSQQHSCSLVTSLITLQWYSTGALQNTSSLQDYLCLFCICL